MIKQLLLLLHVMILITSCTNQDQEKKITNKSVNFSTREKILKDSITNFPDSLLLKEKLIQYYRDSAAYDKAIATVNEAIQTDSLNARLWEIKATLHFENEDTVNTIQSFENALRILPSPGYIMTLGSLYAQTKNKRALDMANALQKIKLNNTEKEAFFIKGSYYSYMGDKTRAISYFDSSLQVDYNYMIAYREKAIALYGLGKYDSAVNVLTKAITLQNSFDEGYYWRGRCLEKLNKPKQAIEDYKTALIYSTDYTEAKEALTRLVGK